jgi:ATP-dependent Clp protease adaptor protein ClpS
MTKEKLSPLFDTDELSIEKRSLILFNDEVNTFDFVIETLIEVCEHDPLQAEQCTILVHSKGKCAVKSGTYENLKPAYTEMLNRKLTVSIK